MQPHRAASLDASTLFTRLREQDAAGAGPPGLAGNVLAIAHDAAARLKQFSMLHGQFTLHDETHCLRVVDLMAVLADAVVSRLNPIELAILILSAYLHDQGMVVDAAEVDAIRSSDEWTVHERNWTSDHPNYPEALAKLTDPLLVNAERERTLAVVRDLQAAMFTDFVRRTHGERSASFVQAQYGADPRLVLNSRSITPLVELICHSHVRPAEEITPGNGFRFDELVGSTRVNLALLAYILRLADILDFDRERTPDSLYRAIHFTSSISLLEWEKHRSVTGWEISADRIVFAAECTHPAYERAIRQFFESIDVELSTAHAWGRSLPSEFQSCRIDLPQRVDASRVGARVDPVARKPAYWYFDLEFVLTRDELVKLLMTDRLYSSTSLFIRELLQNGLDALRHRQALYQADGVPLPDLEVNFQHSLKSGLDVVRCSDNGVGMDKFIVHRFLTRVGRSYYRSPEFERERSRFRGKGCDFDPCARFGIGFMSCFMFGDEITIWTRRDYGIGREHGDPLVVEIKGLNGIVVIRPGESDQPVGTTVEVRGRRKSYVVDHWSDPVKLGEILEGYAVAVEFPVTGECNVPAITGRVDVVPATTSREHPLEALNVRGKTVFTVDLATVDPRLRGQFRVCTLTDSSGTPVVANDEASVQIRYGAAGQSAAWRVAVLSDGTEIRLDDAARVSQVCCDGILVAGEPGRSGRPTHLGMTFHNESFGDAAFLIDARGDLKPNLTAARKPPAARASEDPTWARLFSVSGRGYSKLLTEIVERCARSGEPDRFWLVAAGYRLDLHHLPLLSAWRHLRFPVRTATGAIEWYGAKDLGLLQLELSVDKLRPSALTVKEGRVLELPSTVGDNHDQPSCVSTAFLERLLTAMSTVADVSSTMCELTMHEPAQGACLLDFVIREMPRWHWFLRCGGNLARVLCVAGENGFANAEHPVVRHVRSMEHKRWDERIPAERMLALMTLGHFGEGFDLDVPANSGTARTRKLLGLLHRAINWDSIDSRLRPPFLVFRPGFGIDELTAAHFERWAEAAYEGH